MLQGVVRMIRCIMCNKVINGPKTFYKGEIFCSEKCAKTYFLEDGEVE